MHNIFLPLIANWFVDVRWVAVNLKYICVRIICFVETSRPLVKNLTIALRLGLRLIESI